MSKHCIMKDTYVSIAYKMADMTGQVLEETPPTGLWYVQGHGQLFKKLEETLEGHFPGETVWVKLEPEDAFGDYHVDEIRLVPTEELGNEDDLEVGMAVPLRDPQDDSVEKIWYISDMAEGTVVLEPNHPLAGIGLQFEIKVLDVKTKDEIDDVGAFLDPDDDDDDEGAVHVPDFLTVKEDLIDVDALEDDDDEFYERQIDADSPMAKLATPTPRIIK